jgi:hypothetical protein
MIKKYQYDIEKIQAQILFIKNMKNVINAKNTDEIKEIFANKIRDELMDYCLKKPLQNFMKLNIEKLEEEIESNKKQILYYNKITESKLYSDDLNKLMKMIGDET